MQKELVKSYLVVLVVCRHNLRRRNSACYYSSSSSRLQIPTGIAWYQNHKGPSMEKCQIRKEKIIERIWKLQQKQIIAIRNLIKLKQNDKKILKYLIT